MNKFYFYLLLLSLQFMVGCGSEKSNKKQETKASEIDRNHDTLKEMGVADEPSVNAKEVDIKTPQELLEYENQLFLKINEMNKTEVKNNEQMQQLISSFAEFQKKLDFLFSNHVKLQSKLTPLQEKVYKSNLPKLFLKLEELHKKFD